MIVGIDPGAWALGWAALDDGRLVACGALEASRELSLGERAHVLARGLEGALPPPHRARGVYVELMRWRPNDARSQANDLIDVATVGAVVAARLAPVSPVFVTPQTWKGAIPKRVSHGRIRARLDPAELEVLDRSLASTLKRRHGEVLDAIGIALHGAARRVG